MFPVRSVRRWGSLAAFLATLAVASAACGEDEAGPDPGGSGRNGDVDAGDRGDGADVPPPTRAEFGLDARPANKTCKAPPRPPLAAPVAFERVYGGLNLASPMMMAQMPGDPRRWFVALRAGTIVVFDKANPGAPATAASLAQVATGGEGGLLGFAFHPRCTRTSCRLYVSWTRTGGPAGLRSEVGYFTSTNGTQFGDYKPILGPFDQPYANHNGGGIAFGKDGHLYLAFGDGGAAYDPEANGQKKTTFFSKILRIAVDEVPSGKTYGIPADNPFRTGGGEPATFAYGFRNPFRFSIDRETGDVWVADVGQARYEEIDKVELGGNYGWPCREGAHDYPYPYPGQNPPGPALGAAKCPSKGGLRDPVAEHAHDTLGTRSITGGVVYRGKAIPGMVGAYVYGDFKTNELFALTFDPATGRAIQTQLNDGAPPAANWVAFSEDLDGEVHAVALNGQIWKMIPKPGGPTSTFPDRLSKTGCVTPADPTRPAEGLVPFGVNAPLWSDDAEKERFLAVPDGATITVGADGDFALPRGTVLLKTFRVAGRPVETRLFVHHDDGVWAGYSYEWLDDGSDAVLLPSSKRKPAGGHEWFFPSRSDCVRCHTEAAGRALGLEIGQLNGDLVYPSTNRIANQLTTLEHIGLLAAPLRESAADLPRFPPPTGDGPIEARARAYLHANCGGCHRPKGGGGGEMDLRFDTSFASTRTCNVDPAGGDHGVAGAKLLVPKDPARSLISRRPRAIGAHRMPPLATSIVDDAGLDVIDAWIRDVTACP